MHLLTQTFNVVLLSGHVPNEWATGVIKPIYKNKGDINDPDNYRGIIILSGLGKLFTSVINININSTHITLFTDRRGYAQWPSSFVWTCPETRCNQRHPQSDGAGNARYQTTRAPQEDMAPTYEGRHGGRGFYPRCGPRPEEVEKEDKADPNEIGKRPPRVSKVSKVSKL